MKIIDKSLLDIISPFDIFDFYINSNSEKAFQNFLFNKIGSREESSNLFNCILLTSMGELQAKDLLLLRGMATSFFEEEVLEIGNLLAYNYSDQDKQSLQIPLDDDSVYKIKCDVTKVFLNRYDNSFFDYDETIIFYHKNNVFGSFTSGHLLTNKRLIKMGSESILIENISKVERSGWLGPIKVNDSSIVLDNNVEIQILKSLISFNEINSVIVAQSPHKNPFSKFYSGFLILNLL